MENNLQKLLLESQRNPTVRSKVMVFLSRYSGLAPRDLLSPSSDSMDPFRKTTFKNSCKNLSAIQRSDQLLWPFWAITLVSPNQIPPWPSIDSISNPRKIAFGNSYKNLSMIQRLDQKLWLFWVVTLVWLDKTSPSSSIDSIATPRKTTFINSCKNLSVIQRSDKKL